LLRNSGFLYSLDEVLDTSMAMERSLTRFVVLLLFHHRVLDSVLEGKGILEKCRLRMYVLEKQAPSQHEWGIEVEVNEME